MAIPNTIRRATTTIRTIGGFFLKIQLIAKIYWLVVFSNFRLMSYSSAILFLLRMYASKKKGKFVQEISPHCYGCNSHPQFWSIKHTFVFLMKFKKGKLAREKSPLRHKLNSCCKFPIVVTNVFINSPVMPNMC